MSSPLETAAMYLRQDPEKFYAYPEHYEGVRGVWKRLIYRLGFDFLTIRQRLAQVDVEREYWKAQALEEK